MGKLLSVKNAVVACVVAALGLVAWIVAEVVRNDVIEKCRLMRMGPVTREYVRMMGDNETAREQGKEWVDPAGFTSSTEFLKAIWSKFHIGAAECQYADVWSVAVNPPDDDSFPVLVSANVDPVDLLNGQDMDAPISLVCPEGWKGVFSCYPKRSICVVLRGGSGLTLTKADGRSFCRRMIFYPNDSPPRPNPDTYFLTPTGRMDCVRKEQ